MLLGTHDILSLRLNCEAWGFVNVCSLCMAVTCAGRHLACMIEQDCQSIIGLAGLHPLREKHVCGSGKMHGMALPL